MFLRIYARAQLCKGYGAGSHWVRPHRHGRVTLLFSPVSVQFQFIPVGFCCPSRSALSSGQYLECVASCCTVSKDYSISYKSTPLHAAHSVLLPVVLSFLLASQDYLLGIGILY